MTDMHEGLATHIEMAASFLLLARCYLAKGEYATAVSRLRFLADHALDAARVLEQAEASGREAA